MRIGIEGPGRWLWEFPGSERELWGEWADRFAPLHLDPTWSSQPREFMGRVVEVTDLPDDLDGRIVFGRRPKLKVGAWSAYAGQERRRGLPDHPVFGPLADHVDQCEHELLGDMMVSLRLGGALPSKVVRATLSHRCVRSLHTLELARIERLTADKTLAALVAGGPLPELRRLRWAGDLESTHWEALRALAPQLEELELTPGDRILSAPPAIRRVKASRVGADPAEAGPADLSLWGFDASTEPGWWHHVQTLRLERFPSRRRTLMALADLAAPERLRALVLAEAAPLSMLAPAIVALFEAWPKLQLLTLGTRPVTRPQLEGMRGLPDAMPEWSPGAINEALATFGHILRMSLGEDRVAALEEELGVALPEVYRDFLVRFGDGGAGPGFGIVSAIDPDVREGRPHLPFDPTRGHHRLDGTLRLCDHGYDRLSVLVLSGPDAGTVWLHDRSEGGTLTPHEVPDGCELDFRAWYLDWLELALRSLAQAHG